MAFLKITAGTLFLFFLLGLGFCGGIYYWLMNAYLPDGQIGREVEILVSPGMNALEIGAILKEKGLLKSSLVFRFWVGFYGLGNRLKPGKYPLKIGDSLEAVLHSLVEGREETFRFTIPEGLTVNEIASIIEGTGVSSAASFSAVVNDLVLLKGFFNDWGDISSPEGLLFPETYTFSKGVSPQTVVETLFKLTKEKTEAVLKNVSENGLTKYQSCILASIVEREAKLASEAPLIASVFLNRLRSNIRLESCATVQYALGAHKDRLLLDDLRIPSPFNTYLNPGLPPTPIANFGETALRAVASPARSDFFFFVSTASEGHWFSHTLAEHERFKQKFFRERQRQRNR